MYHADVTVAPALAGLVRGIAGYRYAGLPAGVHVGMPSTTITVVISLDDGLVVSWPADNTGPRRFDAVVSGLQDAPAHVHHDGAQEGIQLELTPAGVRRLLGAPVAALTGASVELRDVMGRSATYLREALAGVPDWPERYRLIETALLRRLTGGRPAGPAPEVGHAWRLVVGSGGTTPIGRVAAEVGWSTRHLGERFRAEYGLSPKTVARVARFGRSHALLRRRGRSIAAVAARCGYADQAHLTRDWRDIAGITPSRWWADDELAFVQDGDAGTG